MTELVLFLAAAVVILAALVGYLASRQKSRFRDEHNATRIENKHYTGHENTALKERRGKDSRDETGREGLRREALEPIPPNETPEEAKLRRLREFQRAEKVREAREEELRVERAIELEPEVDERTARLREFQRAEKAREALEEDRRNGPQPEQTPLTLEQEVAHEVIDARREESRFTQKKDPAYTDMMVGRARDLVNDLNRQFGWQMGQPSIADRLFNTDVESVIGNAVSTTQVDFRLARMIGVMTSFARASTGGRSEYAEVMATRAILGSGKLTGQELSDIDTARRLFGDRFADAAGYVDKMTRAQEVTASKRLGLNTTVDLDSNRDREHAIDLENERTQQRNLGRGGPSLGR